MSGWIKIHRRITSHWLYTEKRKFSKFEAWNDILLNVNYLPNKTVIKGKVLEIKRGESVLSLESWAKRWGWNKSAVRRFLELLKNDAMIRLESETVTIRLSVCNYESYQDERNDIETKVKRRRNADETHSTPIEERKKENNIEERKQKFASTLEPFVKVYGRDMLNAFFKYWIEPNKSLTKLRFELEKTWDTGGRLSTWAKNDKTFNPQPIEVKKPTGLM